MDQVGMWQHACQALLVHVAGFLSGQRSAHPQSVLCAYWLFCSQDFVMGDSKTGMHCCSKHQTLLQKQTYACLLAAFRVHLHAGASKTKKEVQDLVKSLNIQFDNLCQVRAQEQQQVLQLREQLGCSSSCTAASAAAAMSTFC